jgi:hypothetical protein
MQINIPDNTLVTYDWKLTANKILIEVLSFAGVTGDDEIAT